MKRATISTYLPKDNSCDLAKREVYEKLGRLEDIEEKLGIGLETLFEAVEKGYAVKYGNLYYEVRGNIEIFKDSSGYMLASIDNEGNKSCEVKTEDYGVKWALTERELRGS